jgi:hypothetical protein
MRNFGTEESTGPNLGSATTMQVAEQQVYHACSSSPPTDKSGHSQLLLPVFSGGIEFGTVPSRL